MNKKRITFVNDFNKFIMTNINKKSIYLKIILIVFYCFNFLDHEKSIDCCSIFNLL